jgi:hypothetical protein
MSPAVKELFRKLAEYMRHLLAAGASAAENNSLLAFGKDIHHA